MDEVVKAEFARLQDEDKRQNRRIDVLEGNFEVVQKLAMSVEKLAMNMQQMLKEQEKQGNRLDKLEQEPGNSYKRMKEKAVDTVIGVVVGALASGLVLIIAERV